MIFSVTPTESAVFAALRAFLLLPSGLAQFNGYIAGDVLTVTSLLDNSGSLTITRGFARTTSRRSDTSSPI